MKLKGREIGFLRTVKTTCDIEDLCPGNDINRFNELMSGNVKTINTTVAKLIHLMNEGYEMNKAFNEDGYEAKPLTVEEIMYLDQDTFQKLADDMMKAFQGEKNTVELEESKKKLAQESE